MESKPDPAAIVGRIVQINNHRARVIAVETEILSRGVMIPLMHPIYTLEINFDKKYRFGGRMLSYVYEHKSPQKFFRDEFDVLPRSATWE